MEQGEITQELPLIILISYVLGSSECAQTADRGRCMKNEV